MDDPLERVARSQAELSRSWLAAVRLARQAYVLRHIALAMFWVSAAALVVSGAMVVFGARCIALIP